MLDGERPWGRDAMTYEPGSMNAINISCVICHVLGGMWGMYVRAACPLRDRRAVIYRLKVAEIAGHQKATIDTIDT